MPTTQWTIAAVLVAGCFLLGCSKNRSPVDIVIAAPADFHGDVVVLLGVQGAPELQRQNGSYLVPVPPDGKVSTSTVFASSPKCGSTGGKIWGYTPSIYRTGDGIPVGGNLEFFVGTRDEYESYVANKRKLEQAPSRPTSRLERKHAFG